MKYRLLLDAPDAIEAQDGWEAACTFQGAIRRALDETERETDPAIAFRVVAVTYPEADPS